MAQDRSVGGEGLSFAGMELEGGGLEHGLALGLGREGAGAGGKTCVARGRSAQNGAALGGERG